MVRLSHNALKGRTTFVTAYKYSYLLTTSLQLFGLFLRWETSWYSLSEWTYSADDNAWEVPNLTGAAATVSHLLGDIFPYEYITFGVSCLEAPSSTENGCDGNSEEEDWTEDDPLEPSVCIFVHVVFIVYDFLCFICSYVAVSS